MTEKQGRILIIDDDEAILMTLRILLRKHFAEVITESTPQKITQLLAQQKFNVVLLDMNFSVGATSGKEGFYWLHTIKEQASDSQVIMMTAYGEIDLAIRSMKEGATDFVTKPWENDKLISTAISAYKQSQMTSRQAVVSPSMPTIELSRIFMFLDLRSSTQIAEKLGHVKYFSLLNDFFADISDPIVENHGEIYQYVGDEVVVSWEMEKGIEHAHCLKCFFQISDKIDMLKQQYIERYGLKPKFKAGMHFGKVSQGSVGTIKKEIVYSGEVLNTASRIEELCNRYRVNLLVSKDLADMLPIDDSHITKEIGSINLRGKQEAITLVTIQRMKQI